MVYQLQKKIDENDVLLKHIEALKAEVAQEKKLRDGRLALLETEKEKLKKEVDAKTTEIQSITEDKSKTTAAIEALTTEVSKKSMELETLSADLEAKKGQVQDLHDQVVIKTGQLAELGATLAKLQAQVLILSKPKDGPMVSIPKIDGYVRAATKDMVEISLGSDDGVTRGQTMFVYRPGATSNSAKLIGRIEILQTTADVSVGKVIPEYSKGLIEKDDRVATRFN
ncbi:MAG: hypothetical protein QM775_23065 [Pirellulales bacterium]